MKKYEYKFVSDDVPDDENDAKTMVNRLNKEGEKGWRLVPSFFFTKRGQMLLEREEK